ncbi:MAG: acyltransferase [Anaerolineae bacterium]|nr:acyltransferase [Phycisphaerae bacterium]
MVVFYHVGFSPSVGPVVIYGGFGVHLFFLLSGYLLFKPFLRAMTDDTHVFPDTRLFYLRRFLRIYPPYFVSLIVFLAVRALTHSKLPNTLDLVTHVLLVFNWVRSLDFFSISGVYWSLAIEAQYYVLLPPACAAAYGVFKTSGNRAAVALIVAFLACGVASRASELMLYSESRVHEADVKFRTVFSYLDLFGFGMLIAYLEQKVCPSRTVRLTLVVAGVVIFLLANSWARWAAHGSWLFGGSTAYHTLDPIVASIGAGMVMLSIVTRPSKRARNSRPNLLAWLGDISFSVYLYHLLIEALIVRVVNLEHLPYQRRAMLYAAISIAPVLGFSWLMYWLVERPSLLLVARCRGK